MIRLFRIWLIFSFTFFSIAAFSMVQSSDSGRFVLRGMPRIIHYTKKEFNADPQFWVMCQDDDGISYFGNNDGALVFDGENWQKVLLPNNSSVRSLKIGSDGTVYAGGYNEFGIIKKDESGRYHFESMTDLLRPEDRNLEMVWQIHEVQGYIVFRSFKMLIAVADGKAITLPAVDLFAYSAVIEDKLYVMDNEALKSIDLQTLEFTNIIDVKAFRDENLVALLPGFQDKNLLAFTKQGSLFEIVEEEKKADFFKKLIPENSNNLITCAIKSASGNYYLGTLSSKVIALDEQGGIIASREVFNNLQDNTVLNLYESTGGNIWALLNNGIDCIEVSSPVSLLFENASIYDVIKEKDRLVLATNQGVFSSEPLRDKASFSQLKFDKINGLEGQAWSLQLFEDKVICSHDRGVFVLEGKNERQIPDISGVWKVIAIDGKAHQYLACTYDGLYLLEYNEKSGFQLRNKLEGFSESCRDILQSKDPGVFWVCHGYKGVFRIKIDDSFKRVLSVEHFRDQNGLPSPFNINVFRWHGTTVFTTNHGIYTYNTEENKFESQEFLTGLFGKELNVRKLIQYQDKTWFVHDNEAGYFVTDAEQPVLEKGLFLQLKGTFNRSMECIVPIDNRYVLIGTNTGLYSFDLDYNPSVKAGKIFITSVSNVQAKEPVDYHVTSSANAPLQLPYKSSGIRFTFAAPGFQDKKNVQYSYKLEDVDEQWSGWQDMPAKEYSHLRSGKFAFRVKARSLLGENSEEAIYYFEVLPVWYQTAWAISLFIVIAAFAVFFVVVFVKRKIALERDKARNEEKKIRKVLELEIQQIKLEREKESIEKDKEKLEEDVLYKSKELANYTMLLVKKRELLIWMKDKLKNLKDMAKNENSRNAVRELGRRININLQDEEHLQLFDANFERVHHEFFNELKTNFPDLSQKEQRLCAFVKMNLSNKEIASILNISVRGVETARYRLRKRLSLDHEVNMVEFLEKLSSSAEENSFENIEQEENEPGQSL